MLLPIDTILASTSGACRAHNTWRTLEQLQRPGANLLITGHMPSDSVSMNRVIDALEKQGLEVIAGSGVIRP